jgi:predicted RNA-binding Zn-ribbon protein involved in translation (DUF1610 family)
MTDRSPNGDLCAGCGKQLESNDTSTAPYCSQCAADRAERDLAVSQAEHDRTAPNPQQRAQTKRRLRTAALWVLGVAAVIVIGWRAPAVYSATQPPKPIRIGVQSTNQQADKCISNLWTVAEQMPVSKEPAAGLACPASGKPYVTVRQSDSVVVSCPNPASHDLTSLSVSSLTLVPEVK